MQPSVNPSVDPSTIDFAIQPSTHHLSILNIIQQNLVHSTFTWHYNWTEQHWLTCPLSMLHPTAWNIWGALNRRYINMWLLYTTVRHEGLGAVAVLNERLLIGWPDRVYIGGCLVTFSRWTDACNYFSQCPNKMADHVHSKCLQTGSGHAIPRSVIVVEAGCCAGLCGARGRWNIHTRCGMVTFHCWGICGSGQG